MIATNLCRKKRICFCILNVFVLLHMVKKCFFLKIKYLINSIAIRIGLIENIVNEQTKEPNLIAAFSLVIYFLLRRQMTRLFDIGDDYAC